MNKEALIGKWKINRVMTCSDNSPKGMMIGRGQFDLYQGDQLLYQEQLWHETENQDVLFATKFYRYRFSKSFVYIYFHQEESGRLFMTLPRSELRGSAVCNFDRYTLVWDWISKDHFMTRYRAIGPQKDYVIQSEFVR